ncbi:histone-lysine N-methyltransferase EZA1-like [Lotus japonicus]|uniref:histone-lysine N-methyltransferase EZA1-like n=1 Tax=Lotus japonicus TaxID=34305 RepID=UPI00258AFF48|nr:histone-lysine N-methyltransferase EZA1-like [Lotus japonicus]
MGPTNGDKAPSNYWTERQWHVGETSRGPLLEAVSGDISEEDWALTKILPIPGGFEFSTYGEEQHGEATTDYLGVLWTKLNLLKKQIRNKRIESIKEKLKKNEEIVQCQVSAIISDISRRGSLRTGENTIQMLSSRIDRPFCKLISFPQGLGKNAENNNRNNQDVSPVISIKIPYIERLPPFTCWVHLARNQRMTEELSVINGGVQVYYDKSASQGLMISDSDEELEVPENAKHEFSQGDDQVLWMALEEHGLTEEVLTLASYLIEDTTVSEIQDRYKHLKEKNMRGLNQHSEDFGECESLFGICLDKSLSAALDTFDNLFCRQCFSERQLDLFEPEVDKKPCSDQCYLQGMDGEGGISEPSTIKKSGDQSIKAILQKERLNFATKPFTEKVVFHEDLNSDGSQSSFASSKSFVEHTSSKSIVSGSTGHGEHEKGFPHQQKDIAKEIEFERLPNLVDVQMLSISDWKPLEKELYLKGVEIFARKSCLISRNLLSGLKTCMEVGSYIYAGEGSMAYNMGKNVESTDQKIPSRSRRKRGKPKRIKTTYRTSHENKQYMPCGCQGVCGKECPCHQIGNSCEKYCGCSKLCRNRFGGCNCTKSQCKTRHCACFATNRECDPDVCKNCWISCGDGSLGEPPQRGDGQCENMKLLLGKKERILWAKSDIAGWGAFIKNPVDKNGFLGEYTGELISCEEANGLINPTYLFTLNDQYVVDSFRKGDKLKFANHSSNPNCYAKILFVAGDHRIGIFAQRRIEAGEEIFYDYCYDQSLSPAWALKPNGSNRCGSKGSRGRPKKNPSY